MSETESPRSAPTTTDATSFLGRKSELELARRVLAESRLLTITGPNGVGKSRFAVKLAEQMSRIFEDAPVRLSLRELDGPPSEDEIEALRAHAGIVLVDDVEDRAQGRALAERILARCPAAVVVVTSTTVLGAAGEHLIELGPFVVPPRVQASSRAILDYDSVRLLVERIRMVDPGFTITAQHLPVLRDICAAADGLPAIIELAAAATRFLSIDSVRDGLRADDALVDLLPGAERLVASGAETLARCDEAEQRLLATASLLREPLTLDCLVSLVEDEGIGAMDLVGAFCRLVDRSVLISDPDVEGAFRLLRPVRRSARVALDAAGETSRTMNRIERHLIEVMEALADSPAGPNEVQLARHLLNHRSSLERLFAHYASDPESAGDSIRLIVKLRRRWSTLGLDSQVRAWLEQAITSRRQRDALMAEALRAGAYFSILDSDFRRSAELLAESLQLSEGSAEVSELSPDFLQALIRVGELDVDGAELQLEAVVERTRSSGRADALEEQLFFLTLVNVIRGDHERAEQLFRSSVEWMRARGNRWGMAYALVVMSISLVNRGLEERAGETTREALLMMDSLGDRAGFATCLRLLAALAVRRGNAGRAATLLAAAGRMHGTRTMARDAISGGVEASVRRTLGAREFSRLSARGRQMDRREVVMLALDEGGAARSPKPAELTRRESEIAELLVEGLSSAQIAARLVLSTRTVEGHIQRMLNKLEFRSRSQIAVWMSERMDAVSTRVLAG